MSTKQLNVRLPEVIIDDLNQLSKIYGSQAKALIVAITNQKKENDMKEKALQEIESITSAETEEARMEAADRAIAAMQLLPPEQQQEIAKQEFIRFKKFIDDRIAKAEGKDAN